jgi:hypothetical protein
VKETLQVNGNSLACFRVSKVTQSSWKTVLTVDVTVAGEKMAADAFVAYLSSHPMSIIWRRKARNTVLDEDVS